MRVRIFKLLKACHAWDVDHVLNPILDVSPGFSGRFLRCKGQLILDFEGMWFVDGKLCVPSRGWVEWAEEVT